jgi:hypothetical protein
MPALELLIDAVSVINLPADGNHLLDPPLLNLERVLLRSLSCLLRVRPIPGALRAILDPGSPLSVFPHHVWHDRFSWKAGRDYDELSIAGIWKTLHGQVLNRIYACRLARLRVTVELSGKNLKGDRMKLDSPICQLADPGSMPYILLGLWGGPFVGSSLIVQRKPGGDDLDARLEF